MAALCGTAHDGFRWRSTHPTSLPTCSPLHRARPAVLDREGLQRRDTRFRVGDIGNSAQPHRHLPGIDFHTNIAAVLDFSLFAYAYGGVTTTFIWDLSAPWSGSALSGKLPDGHAAEPVRNAACSLAFWISPIGLRMA